MAVYVDDVRHRFGRMWMCHLGADTEAELLDMVDRIGVARKWIQRPPKASWVHFDISLSKKALALDAGAILTDMYGPVEHTVRPLLWSRDPDDIIYARRKLKQISRIRERRRALV